MDRFSSVPFSHDTNNTDTEKKKKVQLSAFSSAAVTSPPPTTTTIVFWARAVAGVGVGGGAVRPAGRGGQSDSGGRRGRGCVTAAARA